MAVIVSLALLRPTLCGRPSEMLTKSAVRSAGSGLRQLRAAGDDSSDSAWAAPSDPTLAPRGLGVKGDDLDDSPSEDLFLHRSCGTEPETAEQMAAEKSRLDAAARFMAAEDADNALGNSRMVIKKYGAFIKQVKVYWHVIQSGPSYRQGAISTDAINKQMEVLNRVFAKADIRFDLAGVDTTTSAEWFRVQQNSAEDAAMKQALHKGSMQDINIYSASPKGTEGQQIAGYTKLPQFAAQDPTLDGSVVLYSTLPGGEQYELNLGYTLVHEVGHAFGLMHPFDHGCNLPGDQVGDTPYQAKASYDCQKRKTCPGTPGEWDPIHNPMGYSPDSCMTQFSTQQSKKIRKSWWAYRNQTTG